MSQIRMMPIVKGLVSLSPRQLAGEKRAARYLKRVLKELAIPFSTHEFTVDIPHIRAARLVADGKRLPCAGCSMIGGKIPDKSKMISSLVSSSVLQDVPNVNFNPECKTVSCSNHYFAPAIAVAPKELARVIAAKQVSGSVTVEKVAHTTEDILVGNIENPTSIVFAHYDSIKKGAIDNASGVAVAIAAANDPILRANTLFVIAANEELSYDRPVYWGHGFRVFQRDYRKVFDEAAQLIVVDSVGNGAPIVSRDPSLIKLGFPIDDAERHAAKVSFITGDFAHLMSVYHSDLDDGRGMSENYMSETLEVLRSILS